MVVDLHAAKIDQLRSVSPCLMKALDSGRGRWWKHGFSLYVQRVRLQRVSDPRFRQSHRIEDGKRHIVLQGGAMHFPFADVGGLGHRKCESKNTRRQDRATKGD